MKEWENMGNWVIEKKECLIIWKHEGEPLNPWILGKRLELYLQSKGIGVRDRPSYFGRPGIIYNVTYNGFEITLAISCKMRCINIWSSGLNGLKKSDTIDSFAKIIGEFLINGYEPEDKAEFERFVRKYTPVRVETDSHPAYHDETDFEGRFFNADGEMFSQFVTRDSHYEDISSELEAVWRELIELGKENNSD